MSDAPVRLKLYGERHTNTNYLQQLVDNNLECEWIEGVVPTWRRTIERFGIVGARDRYFRKTRATNLGWKHTAVSSDDGIPGIRFITLTKNPYAWIVSMHRRPYHLERAENLPIHEFVQRKFQTLGRDNLNNERLSICEFWNRKNSSYFLLPEAQSLHLTSEEVQLKPVETIKKIATFTDQSVVGEFRDVERSTKKRQDRDSNYYRNYYEQELWRESLSMEALNVINRELDKTLMSKFGYQVINDLTVDNSGD